jgi:hypothetical protein
LIRVSLLLKQPKIKYYMDKRIAYAALAICIIAYGISFFYMLQPFNGIKQEYYLEVDPVFILYPEGREPIGTVIVAHGFAGNIGIMKPMGMALAQNGYRAVLFDFPGHGNSEELLQDESLATSIKRVAEKYGGNDFSITGHSMGSLAVIQYGKEGVSVATIPVSPFYGEINLTAPKNFLMIAGTDDIEASKTVLPGSVINGTGNSSAVPGVTYGDLSNGTGRRSEFIPGADHITIIFDSRTFDTMISWLDETYGYSRDVKPSYNMPYPWFLLCAIISLIGSFPVAYLLFENYRQEEYRLKAEPAKSWRPIANMLVAAVVAAMLVNVFNPLKYAGIIGADTLFGFLTYCGIIGLMIYIYKSKGISDLKYPADALLRSFSLAALMLIYFVVSIGAPAMLSAYDLIPEENRLYIMLLCAFLVLPYNLLNELLFRCLKGWKSLALGAICKVLTLLIFLVGVFITGNGFFILITLPILFPLFILIEAFSYYSYKWTGNVLTGAFLNSLIIAWLLVSTFPLGMVSMPV